MDVEEDQVQGIECKYCSVKLPSQEIHETHVKGKKHQSRVQNYEFRVKRAAQSIFVANLKKMVDEAALKAFFEPAVGANVEEIVIDPRKRRFAIIVLDNADAVANYLSQTSSVEISGKTMPIKARDAPTLGYPNAKPSPPPAATPASDGLAMHPQSTKGLGDLPLVPEQAWVPAETMQAVQAAIETDLRPHRLLNDQREAIIAKAHTAVYDIVQEVDVNSRVVVVGSLVTGLAAKKSDVDICLMTTLPVDEIADKLLTSLRASPGFRACSLLSRDRLPVVTAESVVLHRRIDITINNELAIHNTQLIREYLRVLPRLQPVIEAFLLWHKQRCRSWGSYLVALLAIRWHMDQDPSTPVLTDMDIAQGGDDDDDGLPSSKRGKAQVKTVGEWQVDFRQGEESRNKLPDETDAGNFLSFCHWIANLDRNRVISITNRPVPSDLERTMLTVQDPFELTHNVGGRVSEKHIRMVKTDILKLLSIWRRKAGARHTFRTTLSLSPSETWESKLETCLATASQEYGTAVKLEATPSQGGTDWRVYQCTAPHNVWSGLRKMKRQPDQVPKATQMVLDLWCCCTMLGQADTPQGKQVKLAVVLEAKNGCELPALTSWFSLWKAKLVHLFAA
eukprot:TRINITY_DN6073_c0_g1_i1.p1 TRINITY_DN6073_c0_g1~~TRINITY_DN6073_c0_g1_i1.p1  ORF type:complete len:629 (+),score=121.48 TRINITY_DN6073_c0_g1_i1:27-1889(+)